MNRMLINRHPVAHIISWCIACKPMFLHRINPSNLPYDMNRTLRLSTILRITSDKKTNEKRSKERGRAREREREGRRERSQSTIVLSFLLTLLFDYYYTNEKEREKRGRNTNLSISAIAQCFFLFVIRMRPKLKEKTRPFDNFCYYSLINIDRVEQHRSKQEDWWKNYYSM